MIRATIVVREVGKLKPDYSLPFDLPELPRVGDYISVHRPDTPSPFGEDLIVRHVWWRLEHPDTAPVVDELRIGLTKEIFVECDPALGPYSSDRWRRLYDFARGHGQVTEFEVERFVVRESDLK